MIGHCARAAAEADGGGFTAAQFRDRVENGRKVAIQVLEFLDRHGVTLRNGDLRRIDPRQLDLFGPVEAAMRLSSPLGGSPGEAGDGSSLGEIFAASPPPPLRDPPPARQREENAM
jgi:hypothetical protein